MHAGLELIGLNMLLSELIFEGLIYRKNTKGKYRNKKIEKIMARYILIDTNLINLVVIVVSFHQLTISKLTFKLQSKLITPVKV